MNKEFDVVVIGSGAGGSPIAYEMVKAGKTVLVLEKGPGFKPQYQYKNKRSDYKRDELISDGPEKVINLPVDNKGASYYSSHVEPDLNDEPHIYKDKTGNDKATLEGYTAQCVGGGTNIYGGVSFRFSPTDFKLQSFNQGRTIKEDPNEDIKREARDWPVDYTEFEKYYCKAEKLIGINGTSDNQSKGKIFSEDNYQKPLEPNPVSAYAKRGMEILAEKLNAQNPLKPYRTPLAVITEDHASSGRKAAIDPKTEKTSFVNRYGDPLGFKSSTWVSLLSPISEDSNFELRVNCKVVNLESENGEVKQVNYIDPAGRMQSVKGKVVVVACSAIESTRLLQISADMNQDFNDRINQNDLLGKYFLTHAFGGANATMPERVDKSKALDADWATDICNTDEFINDKGLWAGGGIYNNTSDAALPLSLIRTIGSMDLDTLWNGYMNDATLKSDKLVGYFDKEFGKGLSVSFMANQVPQYTNRIDLHGSIRDKWGLPVAHITKNWHQHDIYVMNTYAEQCGNILRYGGNDTQDYPINGQGGSYQATNGLIRIANHVLGGARFGKDANDSVLDENCRAWNFDNLYVTDGSFMPTSGSGNPTLTIQANSFRVADKIAQRL